MPIQYEMETSSPLPNTHQLLAATSIDVAPHPICWLRLYLASASLLRTPEFETRWSYAVLGPMLAKGRLVQMLSFIVPSIRRWPHRQGQKAPSGQR